MQEWFVNVFFKTVINEKIRRVLYPIKEKFSMLRETFFLDILQGNVYWH